MSEETENEALLEKFSDIIGTKNLELEFREIQKMFSALEKEPDTSSEIRHYIYFIAGYSLGIEKLRRHTDEEMHFPDRIAEEITDEFLNKIGYTVNE